MVCKEDFSGFWLNSFYKKEDKFLCFHRQLRSAQIWSQTDIGGNLVKHNEEGKFFWRHVPSHFEGRMSCLTKLRELKGWDVTLVLMYWSVRCELLQYCSQHCWVSTPVSQDSDQWHTSVGREIWSHRNCKNRYTEAAVTIPSVNLSFWQVGFVSFEHRHIAFTV